MRPVQSALAIVALALAILAPAAAQRPNSSQAALEAARQKELFDGDLDGAVKQYRAIVDQYAKSDRTLAATALVRMAECYRRLGDAQARAAYERVVQEFGDVPAMVAAARSGLASLPAPRRAGDASGLALRRVYEGPGLDWCNGLSSDLRYLSHVDWSTGNIAVADLRSGQVRAITATGSINRTREFGECSVFSPDNKQVAYYWSSSDGSDEMRVAGIDGSKPQTIHRSAHYLRPFDWSEQARAILFEVYDTNRHQLATISMPGGVVRTIKAFPGRGLYAAFSPDGRYIAYSARQSADTAKMDVFLVAADGSQDAELVRHPAHDHLLGWAPDGRGVFFASDRTGSNSVWSIQVQNGKAAGAARLVKPNVGSMAPIRLIGGSLYYQVRMNLSDVYVAPIDLEKGEGGAPAASARPYSATSNFAPDWSPDGKRLAYRTIPGAGDQWSGPRAHISIVEIETGDEHPVRPALDAMDPNGGPKWSPDGRSLLVIGMQGTPQAGVYAVEAATGKTTAIVKALPGQSIFHALWSKDGRHVIYPIGNPTRIMKREIASGMEVELARPGAPAGAVRIALSPDGRALAFTGRERSDKTVNTLNLVPADGGSVREIFRTPVDETLGSFAWTPDGRFLYFQRARRLSDDPKADQLREVWRVTPDGHAEETSIESLGAGFAFSPDGRRVAFARGEAKAELWALENLGAVPVKGG